MKSNPKAILEASAELFIFGCAYALLVKKIENRHTGYTFLLVIIGNAVVLLRIAPIIGWKNALKVFAGFAAAGIPMSFGDVYRGVLLRERYQYAMQETSLKLAVGGPAKPSEG